MYSNNFKTWKASIDLKTCIDCKASYGKVYFIDEWIYPEPPLHPHCRCTIEHLKSLLAGTATQKGRDGADWWLKNEGRLPNYYVEGNEAKQSGWIPQSGNLYKVFPNKMIMGGIYNNANKHLPTIHGRVWYEADINYTEGWRGLDRILFSNDGLIFVTYDHYKTFIEII